MRELSQLSNSRCRFEVQVAIMSRPITSYFATISQEEFLTQATARPPRALPAIPPQPKKRDQLVVLERSLPTMSWRLATMAPPGTLRNDQQMTVSRRTAAVWQISPVQSNFAVSIPTSKRREWSNMPDIME